MSEVDQIDNVMTLEDLFLSDQFGKPAAAAPSVLIDEALFRDAPLRAPLVPLAAYPMTSGMHASTTHLRRNRSFAAVSGVAAALLLAVGFISSPGKTKNTGEQAAGPTTTPTSPKGTQVTPPPTQTGPGVTSANSSGTSGINLTSARVGGGSAQGAAAVLATKTSTSTSPPVVTKPTTTVAPTAPAGTVLSPVVHLVGQVVSTTGNTVTGVAGTLTTALPVAAPVTNLVGGLGGTLSGLGNSLIASA
jgi:hypothetical protein